MAEHNRSRSRSPLWSRSDSTDTLILEPSESNISVKDEEVPRELKQQRVLTFKNVPFSWEKSHITDYIKKYCDSSNEEIAKSIQDIVIEKDLQNSTIRLCIVKFVTPDMAQDAKVLLVNVKDKYEGKKVSVDVYRKDTSKKRLQSANASGSEIKKAQDEVNEPPPNEVKMETDETDVIPNNLMKIKIKTVQSLNETIDIQNESTETNPLCEQASNQILPKQFKPKPGVNVLSMRNIPVSWDENKVIEFIKTHAENPDKKIGDSMEAVIIKRDQNNEILACLVQFTTFEMSQAVKFRISKATEKFDGIKIYAVDYRTKFDIRRGPANSQVGSSTDSQNNVFVDPIDIKEVQENTCADPWILILKDVSDTWTKIDVETYVKKFTGYDMEIAESLEDISIGNEYYVNGCHAVCHVKFSCPKIARKAHNILSTCHKKKKTYSKTVKAFLDTSVYLSDVFDLIAKQNKTRPTINDEGSSNADVSRTLLLSGIPSDWQVRNVSEHIRRITSVKKEILASVEGITIRRFKSCPYKNNAIVKFKYPESAAAAKILLSKCQTKIASRVAVTYFTSEPGTKFDSIVTTAKTQMTADQTQITTEETKSENRTLCLRDVPKGWTTLNIANFIEKYTNSNIAKAIQYIHLHNIKGKFSGVCIVRFSTVTFAELANNQLKTVTDLYDGNRIHCELDNTNLVIWTADNRPNIAEMNMRNQNQPAMTDNNRVLQVLTNPTTNRTNSSAFTTNSSAFTTNSSAVTTNSSAVTINPSTNTIPNTNLSKKGPPTHINVFGPEPTMWHVEHKAHLDQYGLSTQFLNSLGLKAPLHKIVFVQNLDPKHFRDKETLCKLFSVAGTVVSVQYFDKNPGTLQASVEFDHPVEAVQAISMFNNQTVHDSKLLVTMDKKSYLLHREMPDGVTSLGRGLGKKGMPLRGIKHKIELANLKKHVQDELGKIKCDIKEIKALIKQNNTQAMRRNQDMDTPIPINPVYQSALNDPLLALRNLFNPQVLQMLQSLMQQNMGSTSGSNVQSGYVGDPNMQMGLNTHGGMNMQGRENMRVTPSIQGGPNMQNEHIMFSGPNMHGEPKMLGEPNIHGEPNMQGGQFIHGGSNMQAGPYMHGEPIMQGGQFMQGQIMNGEPNMHGPAIHGGLQHHGFWNVQNEPIAPNSIIMHSAPNIPSSPVMHSGPIIPSSPIMHSEPIIPSSPIMHSEPNIQSRPISPEIQPGPSTMPGSERSRSSGRSVLLSSSNHDDNSDRRHKSVLFSHLPPSVTLKALKIKMREFGDIQMAALSSPGRAVVVFSSPLDAAACVKRLDGTRVDGQTIDVTSL